MVCAVVIGYALASGGLEIDQPDKSSSTASVQQAVTATEVKKLWDDMELYAEFYCGEEETLRSNTAGQPTYDSLSGQTVVLYREAAALYNRARPHVSVDLPSQAPSLATMVKIRC